MQRGAGGKEVKGSKWCRAQPTESAASSAPPAPIFLPLSRARDAAQQIGLLLAAARYGQVARPIGRRYTHAKRRGGARAYLELKVR